MGRTVLIIDLDVNAGSTKHFGIKPEGFLGTFEVLMGDEEPLDVVITRDDEDNQLPERVHLLAGSGVAVVVGDIRPQARRLRLAVLNRHREGGVSERRIRPRAAHEDGRRPDAEEGAAGRIWTNDHTALASKRYRRAVVHYRAASARRDRHTGRRRDGAALRVADRLICRDVNRPASHGANVSTGIVHHVQTPGAV